MDNITVVKAREPDSPYIKEKLKKYILDSENTTWEQFFVAKRVGKTVAFGRIIDHADFFEIASLGVDYYHRHKGVGTKLLLFLVEEAKKLNNRKPLYLVTHRSTFFQKSGFEETAQAPKVLEDKKYNKCILPPSKIKIMKLTSSQ